MVQCVSILGSTGSIGRQSLDIIRRLPGIRVAALTAGTNVERMAQQCREFSPKLACHGNAGSRSGTGGTNKRSAYPGKLG